METSDAAAQFVFLAAEGFLWRRVQFVCGCGGIGGESERWDDAAKKANERLDAGFGYNKNVHKQSQTASKHIPLLSRISDICADASLYRLKWNPCSRENEHHIQQLLSVSIQQQVVCPWKNTYLPELESTVWFPAS